MADHPIPAAILVDDTPLNASYYWRLQHTAFGYVPSEEIWGDRWRNQAAAALNRIELFEAFADLTEEFGLRGKFTMLPRPAGLGRLDESIRGFDDAELARILDCVRSRIAPHFEICPEVLTHTMGIDIDSGALLPHSETAWLSHLSRENRHEELERYIDHAYAILRNCGFKPAGITVGGMTDPSGIARGEMAVHGHHRENIARAAARVAMAHEQGPLDFTWVFIGGTLTSPRHERVGLPDVLLEEKAVPVYSLHYILHEALAPLFCGEGDPEALAREYVSDDGESGKWVELIESGKALVLNMHGQTLASRGTMLGLKALRLSLERLRQRYGDRIRWCTIRELCAWEA